MSRFNWWKQHPRSGGCCGKAVESGLGARGSCSDAVAGHFGHQRAVERPFWDQIAEGDLPTECAVAVGVSPVVGTRWFRDAGGMSPYSWGPPPGRFLTFAEREEIAVLRARGNGVRQIAAALGRSPSSISRELRRNAATRSGKLDYRASVAQWKAELFARHP